MEMEEQIVRVGFHSEEFDQTRPVKFGGRVITTATNRSKDKDGPNFMRWHDWTLYKVLGGYRVLDQFNDLHKDNHTKLSAVLTPKEVARAYPMVANVALDKGTWGLQEVVSEASENEETGGAEPASFEEER